MFIRYVVLDLVLFFKTRFLFRSMLMGIRSFVNKLVGGTVTIKLNASKPNCTREKTNKFVCTKCLKENQKEVK